jgi:hypothetical protein
VASPGGRFFATATVAIFDFVLEVRCEKAKGEQGDLGLYRAAETKDGLRPGLVVRLENKSRAPSVRRANIIFPKGWMIGFANIRRLSPDPFVVTSAEVPI